MKKRLTDEEIDQILRTHLGEEKAARMPDRLRRAYADVHIALDEQKADREANEAKLQNLRAQLELRRNTLAYEVDWPAEAEPLVLTAVALLKGKARFRNTIKVADELAATRLFASTIGFALHRLVSRGFLSEDKGSFTITPEGKRALEQAKETSKRWIAALESMGKSER